MVFLLLPRSGACLDITFYYCAWALEEVAFPCSCTLGAGSYERYAVRYCCYAYGSDDPGPLFIMWS